MWIAVKVWWVTAKCRSIEFRLPHGAKLTNHIDVWQTWLKRICSVRFKGCKLTEGVTTKPIITGKWASLKHSRVYNKEGGLLREFTFYAAFDDNGKLQLRLDCRGDAQGR